jgi:hypothetical protein
MSKKITQVLLVLEVQEEISDAEMQARLDDFREEIQPDANFGMSIFRATTTRARSFDIYGGGCRLVPVNHIEAEESNL